LEPGLAGRLHPSIHIRALGLGVIERGLEDDLMRFVAVAPGSVQAAGIDAPCASEVA
jgi:hypothetical protein